MARHDDRASRAGGRRRGAGKLGVGLVHHHQPARLPHRVDHRVDIERDRAAQVDVVESFVGRFRHQALQAVSGSAGLRWSVELDDELLACGGRRVAPPKEPAGHADEIFDDEAPVDYIDLAKELEEELEGWVEHARELAELREEEPGVIISKVEDGEKAAVAGLRPFEIITHVDDQPVMTAKGFEKLHGTLDVGKQSCYVLSFSFSTFPSPQILLFFQDAFCQVRGSISGRRASTCRRGRRGRGPGSLRFVEIAAALDTETGISVVGMLTVGTQSI